MSEQALQWVVGCHPEDPIPTCREELEPDAQAFRQLDPWSRQIGPGFDVLLPQHPGVGRRALPAVPQGGRGYPATNGRCPQAVPPILTSEKALMAAHQVGKLKLVDSRSST